MPGPLQDVRVLDLTDELGAYCAKLLADLGADVIKVEPPGGAPGRFRAPFAHDEEGPETSLWWCFYNTNKRSITLDINTEDGKKLLTLLAETADVLIEDSMPGTMEALGLGYSVLSTQSPALVYTSITPFGQEGPHARYKASDLVGQAMGGFMYRIGWPDDPPNSMGANPAYSQAGAHGALGTLMALYHRDLTGQGQHVDVSMQETMSIINYDGTPRWSLEKKAIKRAGPGQGSGGQKATRVWPCKDGQVRFQLVQSQAYAEWPRVVKWLEDHGVAEDLGSEEWAEPFHRMANLEHPEEVIKRFFMTRTARELQEEGQSRRIMVMAFNKVDGLFTDPQLVDEGFFQRVEHPALGETFTYPGAPYRLSKTPWAIRTPAPSLGQHNEEIYEGELGHSEHTRRANSALQSRRGAAGQLESESAALRAGGRDPLTLGRATRLPLSGVRVLDFTWVVAGPTTTKWLAAYGAEVIKVESNRGATDMVRTDGGATPKGKSGANVSGSFGNMNTDKLAIALNMNHEKGKAIARRLVEVSDVVIENFTPRVMPGWGFGYEDLKKINPDVIAVSMPGLGSTGPHAHYRGLGSFFMVRTGLDDLVGYPHRPTVDMGFAFPDASVNPVHTAVSILAALHYRQRTGEGQRIELRQFESTVNYLNTALLDYAVNGRVAQRTGSRHPNAAPHGVYRCAGDDRWCAITVFTEDEWLSFCKATSHADWANDPRFSTLAARKKHEDELDACINAWTETLPADEVMNLLQLHGVAAGVVQHAGDLIETDPQMKARGFYQNLHHDEIGDMTFEGIPFKLRSTPGVPKRPAPLLGEHNDFVLQDVLGMTEQEVNDCMVDGAVM